MKNSLERELLEEHLQAEPAGSPKIQALADYARLRQVQEKITQELKKRYPADDTISYWERQEGTLKIVIDSHSYTADVDEYTKAYETAGEIVAPYLKLDNSYQTFLDDLKEINREKTEN